MRERIPLLWGPNYQKGIKLQKPRGHLAGVRAIAKYRRWKRLAERMRFLREGE